MGILSSKTCIYALRTEFEVVDWQFRLSIFDDELDSQPVFLIRVECLRGENLAVFTVVRPEVVRSTLVPRVHILHVSTVVHSLVDGSVLR